MVDMKIVELENNMLSIEGDIISKDDLYVEISDYGDHYYDVSYIDIKKDSLIGGCAYCGIHKMVETRKIANELLRLAKLPKTQLRKVKTMPVNWY